MTTTITILLVSVILALTGCVYELTSKYRTRTISASDEEKPSLIHRNLRLLGHFNYTNGSVYYLTFCFGPFPLLPIGCYWGHNHNLRDIEGRQTADFKEVVALYFRWGWLVAIGALITLFL